MTRRALRWWDELDWFEQIMVAGIVWTTFWAAAIHAAYPWLERMVTS